MQGLYTSKIYNNRITIPKDVRERLNIKDGDGIVWEIKGANITVKKNEEKKYVL